MRIIGRIQTHVSEVKRLTMHIIQRQSELCLSFLTGGFLLPSSGISLYCKWQNLGKICHCDRTNFQGAEMLQSKWAKI